MNINQKIFIDNCFTISKGIFDESDKELQKAIKQQREDRNDFLNRIGRLLLKYTIIDGYLNMTDHEKIAAKIGIQKTIDDLINSQYKNEVGLVKNVMNKTAEKKFYSYEYLTGKTVKYDPIDLNAKIDNKTFMDRMYSNKDVVSKRLTIESGKLINGTTSVNDINKNLNKVFDINENVSTRLNENQVTIAHQTANNEWMEKENVEQVIWIATLDLKTCNDCQTLDNTVFKRKECPAIPRHVVCRCCTAPIIDTTWRPSYRMDNCTKQNIDYVDYDTWFNNKYGNENPEE